MLTTIPPYPRLLALRRRVVETLALVYSASQPDDGWMELYAGLLVEFSEITADLFKPYPGESKTAFHRRIEPSRELGVEITELLIDQLLTTIADREGLSTADRLRYGLPLRH